MKDSGPTCLLLAACLLILVFCPAAGAGMAEAGQTDEIIVSSGMQEGIQDQSGGGFDEFDAFGEFDPKPDAPRAEVYDPLSGYNRFMTKVNDRFYFWVLKPAASGYAAVTPRLVRKSVNRFFKNLGYPVRLVNNLLQLKIRRAGVETARFLVNSTIGLAGFADPAERWMDFEAYPEDFGQTLGVYGVGGGFHLVWPLLGPSNLRDSVAMIPDSFLNPLYYINDKKTATALTVYERVNYTSLHLGEYESLKKDAVDWYIFLRNAYEGSRKKKIEE